MCVVTSPRDARLERVTPVDGQGGALAHPLTSRTAGAYSTNVSVNSRAFQRLRHIHQLALT
jgi:hypothetical protein